MNKYEVEGKIKDVVTAESGADAIEFFKAAYPDSDSMENVTATEVKEPQIDASEIFYTELPILKDIIESLDKIGVISVDTLGWKRHINIQMDSEGFFKLFQGFGIKSREYDKFKEVYVNKSGVYIYAITTDEEIDAQF